MGVGIRQVVGRVVLVVAIAVTALVVAANSPATPPGGAQVPDPSGEFTALPPARLLDTRTGLGQPSSAPVGPGATIELQVTGRGGVPATGVSAAVVNITAVGPTASGFLTVYPTGANRPGISNVNFVPGDVVPNMVTVALGTGGRISISNPLGSTHVLADVVGFYAGPTGPAGSRFHSVPSSRRFDTRSGWGLPAAGAIGPGGTLRVGVTGAVGVPATGVTAVVMNVTVVGPTAAGYLRVTPAGGSSATSSLNFSPGQTVPNLVTVAVGPGGAVDFFNPLGATHVIADVVGYYGPGVGEEGRFVGIVPERFVDSRRFVPETKLPGGYYIVAYLGGGGGVPAASVDAAVLNVTITEPTEAGFVTVFDDDDCDFPNSSNLNFGPGQTVANQVVTGLSTLGSGSCADPRFVPAADVLNALGDVHFIIDVFGYFTTDAASVAASPSGRASAADAPSPGDVVSRPATAR